MPVKYSREEPASTRKAATFCCCISDCSFASRACVLFCRDRLGAFRQRAQALRLLPPPRTTSSRPPTTRRQPSSRRIHAW
jgi:hypothetical protein